MNRLLLVILCMFCALSTYAQTFTYKLVKVVHTDTGDLIQDTKINYDEVIYITFSSNKKTCYKSDEYGNRIITDGEDKTLSYVSEGTNMYNQLSNKNGIMTFKCTYKLYRLVGFPLKHKELSGECDDYLYISTDYKKQNINNDVWSRDYDHQTRTYGKSFKSAPLAIFGGKRTYVYEKISLNIPTQESVTPKHLW